MISRDIAKTIINGASQIPIITLTGPRQAGKTTIAKSLFSRYEYVN